MDVDEEVIKKDDLSEATVKEEGGAWNAPEDEEGTEEDEEGPIEREIDVYLNRIEDATFSLLQYPLRPVERPYSDDGELIKVGFRKQQRTLQMAYALNNRTGETYNAYGDALPSDDRLWGSTPATATTTTSANTRSHQLKSQQAISPHCSYGLGLIRDGNLYITPITSILQFRPDFEKVDAERLLDQQKTAEKIRETSERLPSTTSVNLLTSLDSLEERCLMEDTPPPTTATALSPLFPTSSAATFPLKTERSVQKLTETASLVENVRASDYGKEASFPYKSTGTSSTIDTSSGTSSFLNKRSRLSHSRLRDAEEEEPWLSIDNFYNANSPEASEIVNVLCSMKKVQKPSDPHEGVKVEAIIEDVIPDVKFVDDFSSYLNYLCSTTQERDWSQNTSSSHALTTSSLSYLSLSKLSLDQQILEILKQKHVETFHKIKGYLTRPWPDGMLLKTLETLATLIMGNWVIKSQFVYENYELLCRDFLLGLLMRQEGKPGIPKEPLKMATCLPSDVLQRLLMEIGECHTAGWQFKLQRDVEFCKSHPEEVARSDAYWKERMIFVVKEIQKRREEFSKGNKNALITVSNGLSKELIKSCEKFLHRSVHTVEELKEMLENLHSQESLHSLTRENLLTALPHFAIEIGSVWALKNVNDEHVDKYRNILISLFRRFQQPVTKTFILKEFEKVLGYKFDLPDFTFRKLVREFAIKAAGDQWIFKGNRRTACSSLFMKQEK